MTYPPDEQDEWRQRVFGMRDHIALDEPARIEEQACAQRADGGCLQCMGVAVGRPNFLDDFDVASGDPMVRTVAEAIRVRERALWLGGHYAYPITMKIVLDDVTETALAYLFGGEIRVPLCDQEIPAKGTE